MECVMWTNLTTRSKVDAVQRHSCLIFVGAALSVSSCFIHHAGGSSLSFSSIQIAVFPSSISAVQICCLTSSNMYALFLLVQLLRLEYSDHQSSIDLKRWLNRDNRWAAFGLSPKCPGHETFRIGHQNPWQKRLFMAKESLWQTWYPYVLPRYKSQHNLLHLPLALYHPNHPRL